MLGVGGWAGDLESETPPNAAEVEAVNNAEAERAADELPPLPPSDSTPAGPAMCLVTTTDYPQWRTVRSFKPAPPRSPRSQKEQQQRGGRRRGGHRRYIRADGTVRTESRPTARAEQTDAMLRSSGSSAFLPAIASARGAGTWVDAYARKGTWESQLSRHAARQKQGQPSLATGWEKARAVTERVRRQQKGQKVGWDDVVKPWLAQFDASGRRLSDRERQLAKARVEKLVLDKAAAGKRLELETKGRKLLKDIEFLQRKAETRLQEERLTEEIKWKLDELTLTRKRIDALRNGAIKQATLHAIEEVHIQMCRELFDDMDADGGGCLDIDEIRQLSVSLGSRLTQKELERAMAEMDEDGGGEVDFHEFYSWWCSDKKAAIAGPGEDQLFSIVPL